VHDTINLRPKPKTAKFKLETINEILAEFANSKEEWLVKKFWPARGVAVIYGKARSFKSFLAIDLGLAVAGGVDWAGRKTKQAAVIYIAAEAPAGVRKRIAGRLAARDDQPPYDSIRFRMIPAAPKLGAGQDDLSELIASIDATGVAPGLITIDTLAQTLGAGDENSSGMIQYVANATALANHFKCLVLIVHHVGLSDDQRLRGHSSLHCGIDAQALCDRKEGTFSTTITLQKLKDDEDEIRLEAQLSRVVIRCDEDGDDVSTLVVDSIKGAAEKPKAAKSAKPIPRRQRLLMDVIAEAIAEIGESIRPSADAPLVRAVPDEAVRERLYARIAEKPRPNETPARLAERQRKTFNETIRSALEAKTLAAVEQNRERFLWIP